MLRRPALAVAPLVLLAAALVGCAEPTRLPPPEPAATADALFASDEEAFAAALAAYEGYLAVSNAVTADASVSLGALQALTTPEYFIEVEAAIADLRSQQLRSEGRSLVQDARLQQFFQDSAGISVTVYICLDVSNNRLVDSSGTDRTPNDRDPLVALAVTLIDPGPAGSLLVSGSESWPDGDLCA